MTILSYLKIRKKEFDVKNERKHGRSVRNGNAPSPYTKYEKKPYKYDTKSWVKKWPHLASTQYDLNKGYAIVDAPQRDKFRDKRLREYA